MPSPTNPGFEPVAIIGQSCVLPGALTPTQLWQVVRERKDLITAVPPGYWGLDPDYVRVNGKGSLPERAISDRGGYVRGFEEIFDASDYSMPADKLLHLDTLVHWLIYTAQEATRDAGLEPAKAGKGAVILGNLSYPSHSLSRYATAIWSGDARRPHPINRFMSGYPAHVVARATGIRHDEAFCLDAACASSLYAIKLACDRLHDHSVDYVLCGAVNRADDLFLHMGFTALQALSRSGRSRPFHQEADGLLPAEGAAMVVLKRLSDAVRDGDAIAGVIRAVGLSNDGNSRGFLAPSKDGQLRAMQAAYARCGLEPADISYIECHATGTPVGDSEEILSMQALFGELDYMPIGSLKSNMGHLITASGMASLIKVLGAFKAGELPPTLHAGPLLDAFAGTPFKPVLEAQSWRCERLRRAAINNFGFGGNNAHLIVEEWQPRTVESLTPVRIDTPIAVIATGVITSTARDLSTFARQLFNEHDNETEFRITDLELPVQKLRFPPADLQQGLPQQSIVMQAVFAALEQVREMDHQRSGIIIGMQCDGEIARYRLRWQLEESQHELDMADRTAMQEGVIASLRAPHVIGAMPNIVANRLNAQFNWQGMSYTVSNEELSGLTALRDGIRLLQTGELDTVVIGAVDMSCEPVHESAAKAVLPESRSQAGDGAVVLVLKRLPDAEAAGETVQAVFPAAETCRTSLDIGLGEEKNLLTRRFGHIHCASGLLQVLAAIAACSTRMKPPVDGGRALPWLDKDCATGVSAKSFSGQQSRFTVRRAGTLSVNSGTAAAVQLYAFSAPAPGRLAEAIASGRFEASDSVRLVVTAFDRDSLASRLDKVRHALHSGASASTLSDPDQGIYCALGPMAGDLAFVFAGATAYAGMGRELLTTFPLLRNELALRSDNLAAVAEKLFIAGPGTVFKPFDQLKGSSVMCQAHAILTRQLLGLQPAATLGMSSGETNALFAMGAWHDMDSLLAAISRSSMYDEALTGQCQTLRQVWGLTASAAASWKNWRVLAPVSEVQLLLEAEPHVAITIINSDTDCIIGGPGQDCERVLDRIGRARVVDPGHDMVVHTEAMKPFAQQWKELHTRETTSVKNIRFYTNASGDFYQAEKLKIADALMTQALFPVDFRPTVLKAWNDGIRVFLEHGPRDILGKAIRKILADKTHLVLSLDSSERDPVAQLVHVAATLHVHGIDINVGRLNEQLAGDASLGSLNHSAVKKLKLPAHFPSIELSDGKNDTLHVDAQPYRMPAAPELPPVLHQQPWAHNLDIPQQRLPDSIGPPTVRKLNTSSTRPAPASVPPLATATGSALGEFASEIAAVHRDFVNQQTRLHHEYLALQHRAWQSRRQRARITVSENLPISPTGLFAMPGAMGSAAEAPLPKDGSAAPTPSIIEKGNSPAFPAHGGSTAAAEGISANRRQPTGMRISRSGLETLASGLISSVLGPVFEQQDQYDKQVRLPEPPLLLVDRVTGLAGEPGTMGTGTIWTETDVPADAWYLHHGRMRPGVMIESGQADLLLISWLGADFLNRGERVYRLLGCELVWHEEGLPKVGDTLQYEIHVDGHAVHGDVRLFFFHYDCWIDGKLKLSVRNGQAGFFSDQELKESGGVLWSAEEDTPKPDAQLDQPERVSRHTRFNHDQVAAFVDGRAWDCFGEGFELIASHQRTPSIPGARLALLDEITEFDPQGGPWHRGYLKATMTVTPDHWFYQGHFKNDPCMPGTLMADAATQAMAFYMAAIGCTIHRDGWRFEPMPGENYKFVCRGQVIPDQTHHLTYEIFIEEIILSDCPVIYAAMLCTSDSLKVFHCRRFGLKLVPDWPLSDRQELISGIQAHYVRSDADVRGDFAALLACAWGKPSTAFGEMYRNFDGASRIPRLPGPPYHFISRIMQIDARPGERRQGTELIAEYDIVPDAWYFAENDGVMPFCVLLEALLQPCGWLASYLDFASDSRTELAFRNLDGDESTQFADVLPDTGTLRTRVVFTRYSQVGDIALVFFKVDSYANDQLIMSFNTSFGFFTKQSLQTQAGLPTTDADRKRMAQAASFSFKVHDRACSLYAGKLILPGRKILMIDEITGFDQGGGSHGQGRITAIQNIDPDAWYFKAHFFQDPVQPGSLGLEALLQLLRCYIIHSGLANALENPRFEAIALNESLVWKYRGQVTPLNQQVFFELDIVRVEQRDTDILVVAEGSLWADGLRIYEVNNMGMRAVSRKNPGALAGPDNCEPGTFIIQTSQESISEFWQKTLNTDTWPGEQIFTTLIERFIGKVQVDDPRAIEVLETQPVLFFANHQTGIESALFGVLMGAISKRVITAIAKNEHRHSWLGQLNALCQSYPGITAQENMLFFNRNEQAQMLDLLKRASHLLAEKRQSLLVHIEGTRSTSCRQPVIQCSSALIELAINTGTPVVPVRFSGGLPLPQDNIAGRRLEFPVGYAAQDIYIGCPLFHDQLAAANMKQRKDMILNAINSTGPDYREEIPNPSTADFSAQIQTLQAHGLKETSAAVMAALTQSDLPGSWLQEVQQAIMKNCPIMGISPDRAWLERLRQWLLNADTLQ